MNDGQANSSHAPADGVDLSVVVPAYNEEQVLTPFHERLTKVLGALDLACQVVYVNDGSSDGTLALMHRLRQSDPRVAIVDLSRNFGKEIALTAGLDHATGAWVVVIDADLQDPPELIPKLLEHGRQGYDMVYAKRVAREGETVLKKTTAYAFYRFMRVVSRVTIPEDTGDFRLLSRRAVDSLMKLREQHRFMKGLFAWVGYPQCAVEYRRDPRLAGATKWNYWKLWNFAVEGITSFTIAPLKLAMFFGILTAAVACAYAVFIIVYTLMMGNDVAGYPSLMVVILLLGAVQLITIGIIGEYLGRMFDETKHRPLYLLNAYEPSRGGSPADGGGDSAPAATPAGEQAQSQAT